MIDILTLYIVLISDHFGPECFKSSLEILATLSRMMLVHGSLLTISTLLTLPSLLTVRSSARYLIFLSLSSAMIC